VLSENEQAVRNLTCHLIDLGHKEIGFIGDISISRSFMERYLGYRHAMVDADLPINKNYCILEPSLSNYYSIQEFAGRLDAMNPLPTAFVCANDLVALQIIRYLESVGLRVPTDLSVTGFDLMGKHTDSTPTLSRLTT
ncbi:substrate-binding domain-containing protein, partial [Paenibacillus sp. EKM208P]